MIPSTAHFIWFGAELPWVYVLGLRSAALRGGFERVVLHHEPRLIGCAAWNDVLSTPRLSLRPLDPAAVLEQHPRGPALVDLYRVLEQPAARANVIRVALLHAEGGVYLDTDTITVAPFDALRAAGAAFCGEEHVVNPGHLRGTRNPWHLAKRRVLGLTRKTLSRLPDGWRAFRRIERVYARAVNNAVLGAPAGHPFLGRMLEAMLELPVERRLVRYALGTHLLQQVVGEWRGRPELSVQPPPVFYPLGPELSVQWFREGRRAPLNEVLRPETRLVHWYASVETKDLLPRIDAGYVRERAGRQLFSALAAPFLPDAGAEG